jgi:hypothetical protein
MCETSNKAAYLKHEYARSSEFNLAVPFPIVCVLYLIEDYAVSGSTLESESSCLCPT